MNHFFLAALPSGYNSDVTMNLETRLTRRLQRGKIGFTVLATDTICMIFGGKELVVSSNFSSNIFGFL